MDCQILLDDPSLVVVKIKLKSRRLVRPLRHRYLVLVVLLGAADVVPALNDGDGGDDTRGGCCSYN